MKSPLKLFTIIELLMVIAIISILATMLLPALRKAKDVSNTIACGNQLSQWHKTIAFYSNDYDGWLPAAHAEYGWWMNNLLEHYKIDNILTCPSDHTGNQTWMKYRDVDEKKNFSYSYNIYPGFDLFAASGGDDIPVKKFSMLKTPSMLNLIADGAYLYYDPRNPGSFYKVGFHYFNPCHQGYCNFSFADGHIDKLHPLKDTTTIQAQGGF